MGASGLRRHTAPLDGGESAFHRAHLGAVVAREPKSGRTSTPRCATGAGAERRTFPDHRWRTYLERSALTFEGPQLPPTGRSWRVTTSLPETPVAPELGLQLHLDPRHGFMLRSLYRLGFAWEAFEFFAFVLERCDGATDKAFELQIMYGIGGGAGPDRSARSTT